MTIGVPLPTTLPVEPPAPFPSSEDPKPPDADQFRNALWDARRELFRARRAAMGNRLLGGFEPTLVGGALKLSKGVVQLNLPLTAWTDDGASDTLIVPEPVASNATGVDGAYRAEQAATTTVSVGDGTTGPTNNNDHLVYVQYDKDEQSRLKVGWTTVASAEAVNWNRSIPLAWVRAAGGVFTLVRDLRPPPPWRPRIVQARYDPPREFPRPDLDDLLPGTDVGSFYLRPHQAVVLTLGLQFVGSFTEPVADVFVSTVKLSKGDPDDVSPFGVRHDLSDEAPQWVCAFPLVGENWLGMYQLIVRRPADAALLLHINGIQVELIAQHEVKVGGAYLRADFYPFARFSDVAADTAPEAPIVVD